jgi:mono/diheme cytochrome c family protein
MNASKSHPLSSILHLQPARTALITSLALYIVIVLAACGNNMRDQARCEPGGASAFFADGKCMQNLPPNTVARAAVARAGEGEAAPEAGIPAQLTVEYLQRGAQRYNTYCAPCHGLTGNGNGMIVRRGFPAPPSFHTQRLRDAPPDHYYDVITNGFGRMFPYAYRVEPQDRWAIAAYIRALQLSQNSTLEDVPPDQRQQLQGAAPLQQQGAAP